MASQDRTPTPNGSSASERDDGTAYASTLLLTPTEAAALLRIGRTSLYELIWQGRITPIHIGRSVRFVRSRIEAFVQELEMTEGRSPINARKAS